MNTSIRVFGALALGILVVCTGCEDRGEEVGFTPSNQELAEVRETGASVASTLMKNLGGQLKAALQSGGPVSALHVCQQAAEPLTEASSADFEGVIVRRTTLRPRNPKNAPDEIDRAVLESLMSSEEQDILIEWTAEGARYYQPLLIQEICLTCHGDPNTFPPDLAATLADLYPDDQATGYALGDLRGVIRVDIPRATPEDR